MNRDYDWSWFNDFTTKHNITVKQFLKLFQCPIELDIDSHAIYDTMRADMYPNDKQFFHKYMKNLMNACHDFIDSCEQKEQFINLNDIQIENIISILYDRYQRACFPYRGPGATCFFSELKDSTIVVDCDIKKGEKNTNVLEDMLKKKCLYDVKSYKINFREMILF